MEYTIRWENKNFDDMGTLTQTGEKTLLNLLHAMVKVAELQKSLGLVRTEVDFIPIG